MTLEQIKLKIGERVDDKNGTAYADRYEGIFVEAMGDTLKAVDKNGNPLFSQAEYPELVSPYEETLIPTDGFSKIDFQDMGNIIYVVDVYTDPIEVSKERRINFNKRTFKELLQHRDNPHLEPSENKGYWGIKAKSVFVLTAVKEDSGIKVFYDVVRNPVPSSWGSSDLENVFGYGRGFIEAAIKRAGDILRAEIGLE